MYDELRNQYDEKKLEDIVLICSTPKGELSKNITHSDSLKVLYIRNCADETGFVTIQIKTFLKAGEIVGVMVYGKSGRHGVGELRVYDVGYRLYPHLTIVSGVHAGIDGIEAWEQNDGIEGLLDDLRAQGLLGDDSEE